MTRVVGPLVLAVALAALSASAHGPVRRKLLSEPPPGTEVPRSVPLETFGESATPGVSTAGSRPLRLLAAGASAVIAADVARSESYDEDRLRVHRLHVERVLRGRLDDVEAGVVEIRGTSRRPPLLTEGEHGVFLLHLAPSASYVDQQLGAGAWFAVVGGRDGVIPVDSDAELATVERILDAGAALEPPDDKAGRRRLAFDELASGNARLVADALVELRALPEIGGLADDERKALTKVFTDVRVPATVRIGLMQLLGEKKVADALPALTAATADTPDVLDAILAARTALGSPPTRAEIVKYLDSQVPGIRAAAVRALARLDDPAALDQVGFYATSDREVAVRHAAIEALGASGRPAAVPILTRTFESAERDIKQTSARALLQIGGPAADNALVDLALHGGSTETQTYAALLLLMSRGREDPAVRRLATSNPSPEVRALLEHGLEFNHTHLHN
jgi:HEAT repeat protein